MESKNKLRQQVLAALFAALTAVFAQLAIPINPVPITLGTLAVLLAGGFLGKKYGALSMLLYVLLGVLGIPVFSMMRSGFAALVGPSGGFIIGFIFMALIMGLTAELFGEHYGKLCIGGIIGTAACYLLGIIWFIILTGKGIQSALAVCVIPFLPGDAAKILIASFLIKKYRRIVLK